MLQRSCSSMPIPPTHIHIPPFPQCQKHKKESPYCDCSGGTLLKTAATYSPALRCSTIGALGLNFSVRDGKRWNPEAIAALCALRPTETCRKRVGLTTPERDEECGQRTRYTLAVRDSHTAPTGEREATRHGKHTGN